MPAQLHKVDDSHAHFLTRISIPPNKKNCLEVYLANSYRCRIALLEFDLDYRRCRFLFFFLTDTTKKIADTCISVDFIPLIDVGIFD